MTAFFANPGSAPTPDDPPFFPVSGEETRLPESPPSEPLEAGSTGDGERYRHLGEIGRGGMGAVLEMEDLSLGRVVAMKIALPGTSKNGLRRFVREARLTGQLEHPNVIPVYDLSWREDDSFSFTMKRVRGRSLQDILDDLAGADRKTLEHFARPRLMEIFLKVCDAMALAHARGVLHRDLKPENILVGAFGEVLVMDWGLAKVLSERETGNRAPETRNSKLESFENPGLTLTGQVMGTPAYMSPEQARGDLAALDERSDIWALGGLLYSLLTHEAPLKGDDVAEVLCAARECRVVPPRRRTPFLDIPKELEAICLKAMRPGKSDRYASAVELAAEVRAWLDHRRVAAHRYGLLERVQRFVQRHPALSATAAVLALSTVVGTMIAARLSHLSRMAAMRAVEARHAMQAAQIRAHVATSRKSEAESDLADARRVSTLLRAARDALDGVLTVLQASRHSTDSKEVQSASYQRQLPEITAFEKTLPPDPATRATWEAVRGWLAFLGGREDEAKRRFDRARAISPRVAYGSLFEAMTCLVDYLDGQRSPGFGGGTEGFFIVGTPDVTADQKRSRRRLERCLKGIDGDMIWGESATEDFLSVTRGIEDFHRGEAASADDHLSRALDVPELLWLRTELLQARAQARFVAARFLEGLEDMKRVAQARPRCAKAARYMAELLMGASSREGLSRPERFAILERAKAHLDRALALDRDADDARSRRALCAMALAAKPGLTVDESKAILAEAEADLTRLVRTRPRSSNAFVNRGKIRMGLARLEKRLNRPALPDVERALEDFDRAVEIAPQSGDAWTDRARALHQLGDELASQKRDPQPAYFQSIVDFRTAARLDPAAFRAPLSLGNVYWSLGDHVSAQGGDGRALYEMALAAYEKALSLRPDFWQAWGNIGTLRQNLGDFDQAIAAYEKALTCSNVPEKQVRGFLGIARTAASMSWQLLVWRASMERKRGSRASALSLYAKAFETAEKRGAYESKKFKSMLAAAHFEAAVAAVQASVQPEIACVRPDLVPPADATALREQALADLKRATSLGLDVKAKAAKTPDLDPVRDLSGFRDLLSPR